MLPLFRSGLNPTLLSQLGNIDVAAPQCSAGRVLQPPERRVGQRTVGGPLFVRGRRGVEPTARGRELYATVAEPLNALEPIVRSLEGRQADKVPARQA